MNILYLGQYRDISIHGLHSEVILNDLNKIGQVTSRYILSEYSKSYNNKIIFSDNTFQEEYDILVQNLPIDSLCYTQKIKRNIAIPVLTSELLSESNIDYLNLFDEVLVDDIFSKQNIDTILTKPSKNFNLNYQDFIQKTDQVLSFPSHNQMKKFYTIIDYDHNNEYIFDLVSEFILASLNQENVCLIIYLINTNQAQVNQIQRHISDMEKVSNIDKDNLTKIITAPISCSYSDLCIAHKSCDIFLDLQDYPRNSLNNYMASLFDNEIMSLTPSNTKLTHLRDGIFSLNGHMVFDRSYLRYMVSQPTVQVEKNNRVFTNNRLDTIL
jgi:hypothetical protein